AGAQPLPMACIMRCFLRPVPHGAISALRVGRAVETRWRFGENLAAICRDTDRMFELGGEGAVARYGGPAIGEDFHARFAEIDHRFDGEEHAFLQRCALSLAAIVEHIRRIMEDAAKTMAATLAHHGAAMDLRLFLNGPANIEQRDGGAHLGTGAE